MAARLSARGPLVRRQHVARRHHAQRIDAAPVGAQHPELETADARALAAPRQPAELFHEQARDGVDALGFREPRAEILVRSEEHTSELQSLAYLVCRLLL